MNRLLESPQAQVTVAVAMLVAAALILAFLVAKAGVAVFDVQAHEQRLSQWVDEQDGSIFKLVPFGLGLLRQGETHDYEVVFESGANIYVIGACDDECADLDLVVTDPVGEVVAVDDETDANPLAVIRPDMDGPYTVTLSMASCSVQPCATVYQVFEVTNVFDSGSGTCFAVSPDGQLMTAWHVVSGAKKILVTFSDGEAHEAYVASGSEADDVALLRIVRSTPDWLSFADKSTAQIGRKVFTVGYPAPEVLGLEPKYTDGSISALSGMGDDERFLQLSVPIQPGNSGGAVVSEGGEVVGVITSSATEVATGGHTPQNVNYAIKSSVAEVLIEGRGHQPSATSLNMAIERVRKASCMVTTAW